MHTERFTLQAFVPEDQAFVFEGLSHPEVVRHYGVRYSTYEAARVQMDWFETIIREASGQWWKIVNRRTGESVGAIGMNYYQPLHRNAEIGYWLLPRYWKQGIIREVLPELTNYLFSERRLHRIAAVVEAGNEASCKVLINAGFSYEGTQRDCAYKDGRFISLMFYSLLESDTRK